MSVKEEGLAEAEPGKGKETEGPAPAVITSVEEVARTKWIKLLTLKYWDEKNQVERAWDMAERTTKRAHLAADGVAIFC